jgi:hypothetical protein
MATSDAMAAFTATMPLPPLAGCPGSQFRDWFAWSNALLRRQMWASTTSGWPALLAATDACAAERGELLKRIVAGAVARDVTALVRSGSRAAIVRSACRTQTRAGRSGASKVTAGQVVDVALALLRACGGDVRSVSEAMIVQAAGHELEQLWALLDRHGSAAATVGTVVEGGVVVEEVMRILRILSIMSPGSLPRVVPAQKVVDVDCGAGKDVGVSAMREVSCAERERAERVAEALACCLGGAADMDVEGDDGVGESSTPTRMRPPANGVPRGGHRWWHNVREEVDTAEQRHGAVIRIEVHEERDYVRVGCQILLQSVRVPVLVVRVERRRGEAGNLRETELVCQHWVERPALGWIGEFARVRLGFIERIEGLPGGAVSAGVAIYIDAWVAAVADEYHDEVNAMTDGVHVC